MVKSIISQNHWTHLSVLAPCVPLTSRRNIVFSDWLLWKVSNQLIGEFWTAQYSDNSKELFVSIPTATLREYVERARRQNKVFIFFPKPNDRLITLIEKMWTVLSDQKECTFFFKPSVFVRLVNGSLTN